MPDIAGLSVLVIGGAGGIGRACVDSLHARGAQVAVIDIAEEGRSPQRRGGERQILFLAGDATQGEQLGSAVRHAADRLGKLDACINVVGGAHPAPFTELTPRDWDAEISFNLGSVFLVCRAVVPIMMRQGEGSIVNTSSGYASRPAPGRVAYAAAKAGITGLTRSLAAEVGPMGIRVNAIAPGATDTARFRELLGPEGVARAEEDIPLGHLTTPEDCAAAAVFLASRSARQITGQVLHVNGGSFM